VFYIPWTVEPGRAEDQEIKQPRISGTQKFWGDGNL